MSESAVQPQNSGASWEIGELFEAAWDAFKPNALVLVGATVIMMAASLIVRQILGNGSLGGLVDSGVSAFFMVGYYRLGLDIARGRPADIATLFRGGDRFLVMWVANFAAAVAIGIGFLLLIVPGLILSLGLFFYWSYAADTGLGPIECLKASWELTRGRKGDLFLLGLAMFGVLLTGLVALCVGIFAALPFVVLADADRKSVV